MKINNDQKKPIKLLDYFYILDRIEDEHKKIAYKKQ